MSRLSDWRKTYGPSDIGRFNTSVSSSGDNTLIAASTGKKIRMLQFYLSVASAVNVKFTSSTTSDLTKLLYFAAAGTQIFGANDAGWFETVAGELMGLNLSSGVVVTVGGIYLLQ